LESVIVGGSFFDAFYLRIICPINILFIVKIAAPDRAHLSS
jgi:hypothetical protein